MLLANSGKLLMTPGFGAIKRYFGSKNCFTIRQVKGKRALFWRGS